MQYVLVLQWSRQSRSDLDELVAFEDALAESLVETAEVDGHDIGPTEMNIFICTEHPTETFLAAESTGTSWDRWPQVHAAYREATGESYTIVWPPDLQDFTIS